MKPTTARRVTSLVILGAFLALAVLAVLGNRCSAVSSSWLRGWFWATMRRACVRAAPTSSVRSILGSRGRVPVHLKASVAATRRTRICRSRARRWFRSCSSDRSRSWVPGSTTRLPQSRLASWPSPLTPSSGESRAATAGTTVQATAMRATASGSARTHSQGYHANLTEGVASMAVQVRFWRASL